ncbi:hypothetical protein [Kitasatospora sp. NPDC004289]
MAGQNNRTDGPGPGELAESGEEFDLLAFIAQLTDRASREPGRRLSPAAVTRALTSLVELALPEGVLITTPEEYERSRESAYAQGWQDAVQHLHRQSVSGPAPSVPAQAQGPSEAPPPAGSEVRAPRTEADDEHSSGPEATVLAFPPRIPLVRAADSDGRRELMPHRPRRPSRRRRRETVEPPGRPEAPEGPARSEEPDA